MVIRNLRYVAHLSVGLALFGLALLNVRSPEIYYLWKLSVFTREMGHFLAVGALAYAFAQNLERTGARFRPRPWSLLTLCCAFLFALPATQALTQRERWAQELESAFKAGPAPALVDVPTLFLGTGENEVSYQRLSYTEGLGLDFYPAQGTGKHHAPLVIVVHGGGWDSGDSRQLPELNSFLANRGMNVASIDYRLAPRHRWPAQREDLKAAIAYLQWRSSELKIDPTRLALLGRSAGAQIAGAYAFSKDAPDVRAFVDFYGPTDLTFGYEVAEEVDIINSRKLIRQLHGGDPYGPKDLYESSSILLKVTERPVPTLVLHGKPDVLSWYKHGERLCGQMRATQVPCYMLLLPWAAHGFDWSPKGPGGQISSRAIHYFLKGALK